MIHPRKGGSLPRLLKLLTVLAALDMLLTALVVLGPTAGGRSDFLAPPHLSWQHEPRTTMTIAWATSLREEVAAVRYGRTEGLELGAVPAETQLLLEGYQGYRHNVELTGLTPNTTYYYVVGSEAKGWSDLLHFATAPILGEPFTFLAFADMGTTTDAARASAMMSKEEYNFSIHSGDISYAGGRQDIWNRFMQQIGPMASYHPYMTTVGNHENETREGHDSYLARFSMPPLANPQDPDHSEFYYSFNVSSVHFIALKADYKEGSSLYPRLSDFDPVQTAWLRDDLEAAATDTAHPWIVVFFHYPLFSSGSDHGSWEAGRAAWAALFDRYHVALVITGHDHDYERSYPVWSNGTVATLGYNGTFTDPGAPVYVVTGGGGEDHDRFGRINPWSAAHSTSFEFVEVRVSGQSMAVQAVRSRDGGLLDCFEILHGNATRESDQFCRGAAAQGLLPGPAGEVNPFLWACVAAAAVTVVIAGFWVARRRTHRLSVRRRG